MTLRMPLIAAVLLFSATAAQAKGHDQNASSTCPQACSCKGDLHPAAPAPIASATQSLKGITPEGLDYLWNSP